MAESCIEPQTNCKPLTYQTALPKKPTFQVIRILRYRKLKISKAHSSAKLLRLREQTRQTNPKSTSTLSHKFSCSVSQESESRSGEEAWSSCGRQIPPSTNHPPTHHLTKQPQQWFIIKNCTRAGTSFCSLHFTAPPPSGPLNEKTYNHPVNCIANPNPNPPAPVRNFGCKGKS